MHTLVYITVSCFAILSCVSVCQSQVVSRSQVDSSVRNKVTVIADTVKAQLKTQTKKVEEVIKTNAAMAMERIKNAGAIKPDSLVKTLLPSFSFKNPFQTKPFFRFTGGFNTYNFNYRSTIDTPVAENNIYQHYANGSFGVIAVGLPLRVNYLFRKSNSVLFNDIKDVQILFDASQYTNNWRGAVKNNLTAYADQLKDPLLEMNYKANLQQLGDLSAWMHQPSMQQRLAEYKEMTAIPELTRDVNLTDSANKHLSDSSLAVAKTFLETYQQKKQQLDSLHAKTDSLQQKYQAMLQKVQSYHNMVNQKLGSGHSLSEIGNGLQEYGLNEKMIPAKYRRLMNIRKMGIGRNMVNYSELTSKNISVKGINFEYASRGFYAAVAAGLVDYRYRDFIARGNNKPRQYMYLLRFGKGKPESNHFFITYYKGRKQASFNTTANQPLLAISGVSGELKYVINRNSSLVAEVAESMSADVRTSPVSYSKFDLKDKKNKALSFTLNSYIPQTRTRLYGLYKYTGANFQSFSSFQPNAAAKSWHFKADQYLLHQKLKIAAAIRHNDFSNPYIIQQYNSNTVFKSIQLTYRARKFPTVSVGYQPVSQLTKSGNEVIDNQFNSLNAQLTHHYKIGEIPASSAFMLHRFYNNPSDTGFAYYNATNIFFNQTAAFERFSLSLAASQSKSKEYELNILDGGFQLNTGKLVSIGLGVKVNGFNKQITRASSYGNIQLNLKKWGVLSMVYDNGYLPGANKTFIKNDFFNLVFTQVF